jgi:arrestin-related trafficking adapter 9
MPTRSAGRSPSPSSKRSLLSRLKAPFGPKARHVSEYYIQPDDPHRQYGPGDVITGSVVLKVIKAISVTHITVCLHGYAQVYKTSNTAGEGIKQYNASLAAGKTKKSGGYYGNGFVSLFEDEIVLCGEGRLGEGTYQFNYELMFPKKNMPSSIDVRRVHVWFCKHKLTIAVRARNNILHGYLHHDAPDHNLADIILQQESQLPRRHRRCCPSST